jgi:hypothetical protein
LLVRKTHRAKKEAMNKMKGNILMKKRSHALLTAILLPAILLLAGCATSTSLESRGLPDNDWPRKRVAVMPAVNLTGIPLAELRDTVSGELTKTLAKTGFFNVYHLRKKGPREFPLFQPGAPVDPELMREAQEMGINVLIFETVNPIETDSVTSGIWPSRRKARRFTVSMHLDIVDVNRGIVVLSKEIADNTTVPDEEAEKEREKFSDGETKQRVLKECLSGILEEAAMAVSLSLNREVWTGTVVSKDKERIIINAGRDAGLRPGVVFEVFDKGECITSLKGQTYQLLGPKVGEIKIVGIKPRHSTAEPINGADFKPGHIVKVKHENR